jgi:hypothetical protein
MSNKYEKKELIQLWSIIPSIKQTITSHLKSLNTKKITTYVIVNPSRGLRQAQNVAGLSQFWEPQHSPLDNWISNGGTHKTKCHIILFKLFGFQTFRLERT